jgi:hypothetical protein
LNKDADKRFQTAAQLSAALQAFERTPIANRKSFVRLVGSIVAVTIGCYVVYSVFFAKSTDGKPESTSSFSGELDDGVPKRAENVATIPRLQSLVVRIYHDETESRYKLVDKGEVVSALDEIRPFALGKDRLHLEPFEVIPSVEPRILQIDPRGDSAWADVGQRGFDFPPQTNPSGIHALLFFAPKTEWDSSLNEEILKRIRPIFDEIPTKLPARWWILPAPPEDSEERAGSHVVKLPSEVAGDFLRKIENRLPEYVQLLGALFLPFTDAD